MTVYPLSIPPPLTAEYVAVPLTSAGRSSWFLLTTGIHSSGCPNTTLSDARVGSSTYVMALRAVGVYWGVFRDLASELPGVLGCEVAQEFSPKLVSGVQVHQEKPPSKIIPKFGKYVSKPYKILQTKNNFGL